MRVFVVLVESDSLVVSCTLFFERCHDVWQQCVEEVAVC